MSLNLGIDYYFIRLLRLELRLQTNGTCLAEGTVAGEGSTSSGGGQGHRIWRKLGGLQKWMVGGIFRKFRMVGSEERMWKPSRRIHLSFRKPG